jgi:hypothetical protein
MKPPCFPRREGGEIQLPSPSRRGVGGEVNLCDRDKLLKSNYLTPKFSQVNTNGFLHIGITKMFEVHKNYVLDENQQPIAVQIPIAEFEKIEEILENYGLAKLMEEVEEEKPLSKDEALKYYQSLK